MALNEYDEILETGAIPNAAGNEYIDLVDNQQAQKMAKLDSTNFIAKQKNPDQYAEYNKYAKELNIPVDMVERNYDLIKKSSSQQGFEIEKIKESSEEIKEFYSNPYNAIIAKDDFESISRLDRSTKRYTPYKEKTSYLDDLIEAGGTGFNELGAGSILAAASQGIVDIEDYADAVAEINLKNQKTRANAPDYAQEWSEMAAKESDDINRAWQKTLSSIKEIQDGKISEGLINFATGGASTVAETLDLFYEAVSRPKGTIRSAVESLALSAPSLGLGIAGAAGGVKAGGSVGAAAGSVVPGAGTAAGVAAGATIGGAIGLASGTFAGSVMTEYSAYLNQALSENGYDATNRDDIVRAFKDKKFLDQIKNEAKNKAVTTAAVDAAFSFFAGRILAKSGKTLPGATRSQAIRRTIGAGAADVGFQMAGETVSEAAGQFAAKGEVNLGESILEGVVSLGSSGVDVATGAAVRGYRSQFAQDTIQATKQLLARKKQNDAHMKSVEAVQDGIEAIDNSKLKGRDKDTQKQFIDGVLGDTEQLAFFQSDDIDKIAQDSGQSPSEVMEKLLGSDAAYFEAKENGLPIKAKMSDLQFVEDKNLQQAAIKHFRSEPDGPSAVEVIETEKNLDATIKQLGDEMAAKRKQDAIDKKELGEIRRTITRQLRESGRRAVEAEPLMAFYRVVGQRSGLGAKQLFETYGLNIEKASQDAIDSGIDISSLDEVAALKRNGFNTDNVYYTTIEQDGGFILSETRNSPQDVRVFLKEENILRGEDAYDAAFVVGLLENNLINAEVSEQIRNSAATNQDMLDILNQQENAEQIVNELKRQGYQGLSYGNSISIFNEANITFADDIFDKADISKEYNQDYNSDVDYHTPDEDGEIDFRNGSYANVDVRSDDMLVDTFGEDAAKAVNGEALEINTLEVPKPKQGQGLGSKALKEIEQYAASVGQEYIILKAEPLQSSIVGEADPSRKQELVDFYKKNGFEEFRDDGDSSVMIKKVSTFFQEKNDIKRGRIQFKKGDSYKATIQLFEQADPSTFFHETGHYFLETLGELVKRDDVNQELKDDFKVILDFLEVDSMENIKTDQHEKFARAFEAYLYEGKAPSKGLRKAFHTFKTFLASVYRSIKNLNVDINDDIRGVFDRVLATEEEIKNANDDFNKEPLFADPTNFGMNEQQRDRYLRAMAEAELSAFDRIHKKLFKDKTKERSQARDQIKLEVEEEIKNMPEYRAIEFLSGRLQVPGVERMRLNREVMFEMLPPEQFAQVPNTIMKKGGEHPDAVASYFGFQTGRQMIEAMAALPTYNYQKAIQREIDAQMIIRYPDLVDIQVGDEAVRAIHNERRSEALYMELEHLASNNLRVFNDLVRRISKRPPSKQSVKIQAQKMLADMKVSDIKLGVFRSAERRNARLAGEFLTKGDIDRAFDSKLKELLNFELYRQAQDIKDQIAKNDKLNKKFFQKDEKLSKSRDINLINAGRAMLSRFGLGPASAQDPLTYLSELKAYDPEGYEGIASLINNIIKEPKNYKELTYGELEEMQIAIKSLWDLSRDQKTIEIDGKKIELDEIVNEFEKSISKFDKKTNQEKYKRTATKWEKTFKEILGVKAMAVRLESWVDGMDLGDQEGIFRKVLWQPLSDASDRYLTESVKYKERFIELAKNVNVLTEPIVSDELGFVFQNKGELLAALIHTGNDSNKKKLLLGREWASLNEDGTIDTSKWDAFIKRSIEQGILAKEDYDFVQSVWDLFEELKPGAQRAHKKVYGHYFNEITANSFETPFGTYRGGYAPAKVDSMEYQRIASKEEFEQFVQGHRGFDYPAAGGNGFTKGRVENFNKPLSLDLNGFIRHIDDVVKFSVVKPISVDVAKVVMNSKFKEAIDRYDPTIIENMIKPAINRADKQSVNTAQFGGGASFINRMANYFRKTSSLQIMFANVVNTVEQFSGFTVALTKMGPKRLATGITRYMNNPKGVTEIISSKSEYMKNRFENQVFEMDRRAKKIMETETTLDKMRNFADQHAYFFQSYTQNIIDAVVWNGGYEQAIIDGKTESQASKYADSVVRATQSAARPIDISPLEANPFLRVFQMFMGYFNTIGNLNATEMKKIYYSDLSMQEKQKRALYIYAMAFAMPAILSALLRRAAGGKFDEDEDGVADDFAEVIFGSQASFGLAMVPVVGSSINAGLNKFNDKPYDDRVSASPAITAISTVAGAPSSFYKSWQGDKAAVRDSLTAIGIILGIPLAPISKPITYQMDVNSGKKRPKNSADYARGLITGR